MNIHEEYEKRQKAIGLCGTGDFLEQVSKASRILTGAVRKSHLIVAFGNGGSAAQAAHFALDSVGRFLDDGKHPRPVIDLGSNCGNITAIGNDYSFGQIFRYQLMAFDMIAKVAVGISTSGTSENVLNALAYANARGIKTILLTSDRCPRHGLGFVDEVVRAPSLETPVIQEIHIMVIHLWCQAMEEAGFPKESNQTNN